ncbi:MAG: D-amino acid aminotransferase, partial [Alphaproteobacteria bacterium]
EKAQISVIEEAFDRKALLEAREIFVTSATSFVKPILAIDGAQIGDGVVGPITSRIFSLYNAHTLAI